VKVDKRTLAREWLIFLGVVSVSVLASLISYYWKYREGMTYSGDPVVYSWFDEWWTDMVRVPGHRFKYLTPWLLYPYLLLTFLRSIWWSINTLR